MGFIKRSTTNLELLDGETPNWVKDNSDEVEDQKEDQQDSENKKEDK